MYCRNCGAQLTPGAAVCMNCGVRPGVGTNFCQNCGAKTHSNADVCTNCGVRLSRAASAAGQQKSKIVAGLLGIFLGFLGIHNFYLGYTGKAIAQLALYLGGFFLSFILVFPILASVAACIWGLVEGIMILTGSISTDAQGVPLGN